MGYCYLYKRGGGGSGGGSGGVGKVMTAVGSVIALTNSMNKPLKGLRIFGRTTQNGTPSPTAPVPLVSPGDGESLGVMVYGKNLLENVASSQTVNGVTFTINEDGSVNVNGTATANTNFNLGKVRLFTDTKYMIGAKYGSSKAYLYCASLLYQPIISVNGAANPVTNFGIKDNNDRQVELTKEDSLNVNFYIASGTTLSDVVLYPMVRCASFDESTYEPYQCQTLTLSTPNGLPGIPVASGGNYTDTSGLQWVCDEVDFNRGVRVERFIKLVFNSADGWIVGSATGGANRFQTKQYANVIKPTVNVTTKANILCSNFLNVTAENTWNKTVGICVDARGDVYVYYPDIEQTASAFGAYLASNPMTVIAELATPIETPLTAAEVAAYAALHTNSPNTTIYNDGGAEMEVKYMGG